MFRSSHEKLNFDLNVMVIGMADEARRIREEQGAKGKTLTRGDAMAAARRAEEAAREIENEKRPVRRIK